jgi:hypothetical protein
MQHRVEGATCSACGASLRIAALARSQEVAKTQFTARCPACRSEIHLEMSYALDPQSIQVVGFERQRAKAGNGGAHSAAESQGDK